jgi:hypothetical protein
MEIVRAVAERHRKASGAWTPQVKETGVDARIWRTGAGSALNGEGRRCARRPL